MKKLFVLLIIFYQCNNYAQNIIDQVSHHYAINEGVKIHFVTLGEGPLIVMIHGFPDFWYTWRNQMKELSKNYKVAAIDLRGYNKSDKPEGVQNYAMRYLIRDVVSVIKKAGYEKAIIVGHDWGGAIAWAVAQYVPKVVDKLVVLSTPHPQGLIRELANNKEQQKNSGYAKEYQKKNSYKNLTPDSLTNWVKDKFAKPYYIEAFKNSSIEGMLNYYKASFPKQTDDKSGKKITQQKKIIMVQCPTLAIFGKEDKALLPAGWNDTWNWIDNNFTLVAVPKAGHFIQQDASEYVTKKIVSWLKNN
ncbi:MAG TPA: alpha/beta hydrolase [Ignavibacteriaceae bacterium]|nr:alpha/beta hydrolase [Ignavibacteriaceae bacterium]